MNQRPKKKTTDKGRHSQVKTVRNGSAREDARSRLERRSSVRATADVSSKRSRHARVHPIHGFSSFEDEHHSPAYGTYASASANRKNGAISPSRASGRSSETSRAGKTAAVYRRASDGSHGMRANSRAQLKKTVGVASAS